MAIRPVDAVDQQRQVEFFLDVDAVGDVEPLHLLAGRAGLDGDQRLAEHLARVVANFVDRMGEADPALGVGAELLELALAAAARVDLRLHHPQGAGQLFGGGDRLLDAHRGMAGGHRHAELREQLLGLILVDVHRGGLKQNADGDAKRGEPRKVTKVTGLRVRAYRARERTVKRRRRRGPGNPMDSR